MRATYHNTQNESHDAPSANRKMPTTNECEDVVDLERVITNYKIIKWKGGIRDRASEAGSVFQFALFVREVGMEIRPEFL